MESWYEVYESKNGKLQACFKERNHAKNYSLIFPFLKIKTTKDPKHLEFIVAEKNLNVVASFEYETHALKYNVEYLNGKGIISPNSQ